MTIKELQKEVHNIAKEKGWYDKPKSIGEFIALCHSELSEALEEYRAGYDVTAIRIHKIGITPFYKKEGFPIELADVIIRILDMAEFYGIDLETAIKEKIEYNRLRSYKHGGKII